MRRQIIFGTLLALLIGAIAAAFIWGPDGDWDRDRGDRVEIVRVADDGTGSAATDGSGEVIVIEGQRPFFFPFGLLLVPLVIFLLFSLFRGAFFGWGGPRGGPDRFVDGRGPAWLEEWHRRQHQGEREPEDTTPRPQA
jgi:hypothetical protein